MKSKYLVFIAPLFAAFLMSVIGNMKVAFPFIFLTLLVGFITWTFLIFHSIYQVYKYDNTAVLGAQFSEQESTPATRSRSLLNANLWILKEFLVSCVLVVIYYFLTKSLMYHLNASLIIGVLTGLSAILFFIQIWNAVQSDENNITTYNINNQSKPIIITTLFAITVTCLTWLNITNISLVLANNTYSKAVLDIQCDIIRDRGDKRSTEVEFEAYEDLREIGSSNNIERPKVSGITKLILDRLPEISCYQYIGGSEYEHSHDIWIKVSSGNYRLDYTKYKGKLTIGIGYYNLCNYRGYSIY